ncbi:MAG: hypothetical protein WBK69_06285 [bacterium]
MTRLHLLHTSLPFTHSLKLPTDPFPQKITGRVTSCQLSPTPQADGFVLVTGSYEITVSYTNPRGEKKKIQEILSLEEGIPVETFPDLPKLPQKLAPGEKWELVANMPAPRVAAEPVRLQETLVSNRGIGTFSLIPRAVSVRIQGDIVLDGWLHIGKEQEHGEQGKQALDRHNREQRPPPSAYDNRGIRQENKGGIPMVDEVKPAAFNHGANGPPEAEFGEVGPAILRYAADTEEGAVSEPPGQGTEPTVPRAEGEDTPPAQGAAASKREKPVPYYRLPSSKGPEEKKGSDLMARRKVTIKVEDLLRERRSLFEIPKSKQDALTKKAPRRGCCG